LPIVLSPGDCGEPGGLAGTCGTDVALQNERAFTVADKAVTILKRAIGKLRPPCVPMLSKYVPSGNFWLIIGVPTLRNGLIQQSGEFTAPIRQGT
jgi:hypothetical protein